MKDYVNGYVYFVRIYELMPLPEKVNKLLKIGFSVNPLQRISKLGSLFPVLNYRELIGVFEGTRRDEKQIHKLLENYKHESKSECFYFKDEVEKIVKGINLMLW